MKPGLRTRNHALASTSTSVPVRRKVTAEPRRETDAPIAKRRATREAASSGVKTDDETVKLEGSSSSDEVLTVDYLEDLPEDDDDTEMSAVHPGSIFEIVPLEYPCDICDARFGTRQERNEHIGNHFKTFECEVCNKEFIGDRQFDYHLATGRCKTVIKIEKCVSLPVRESMTESAVRSWSCDICGKKHFQSRRALRLHVNKTHSDRPKAPPSNEHVCQVCDKTFANTHILKNHVREIHTNAQQHKCDECGKQFNRLANLKYHKLIHSEEMPCKCSVCGKAFRTTTGVRLHLRTHTGDRPYKCGIDGCEKAYAYNTDLVRHRRSAHGIYGKAFNCMHCDSVYHERKHLRKHLARKHGLEMAAEDILAQDEAK